MITRRQSVLGLVSALFGGGAVASGAFDGVTTSPKADLRILADAGGRGVALRPGRDDEAFVETDADGLVTEIVLTGGDNRGLSKAAETRFEDIVEVHKVSDGGQGPPIDELYFTFQVRDEGLAAGDPTPAAIAETLSIASASGDIPGEGKLGYFAETDAAAPNDKLTPNSSVPFGIGVDLLSHGLRDLPEPDRFAITLVIGSETRNNSDGNSDGPRN